MGIVTLLLLFIVTIYGQKGVIITGGHNSDITAERSVELFDINGRQCELPDLPDYRNQHTQVDSFLL